MVMKGVIPAILIFGSLLLIFIPFSDAIVKINVPEVEEVVNYSLIPTVNSSNFWDDLDDPSDILGSLINNNLGWITSYTDTNASSICSDGAYLDGSGACINFNNTVESLLVSTTYSASNINTYTYTVDAGDIDSILTAKDGDTYNVSETGGSSGSIIVNFTGVVDFTSVLLRMSYDGSHDMHFGIYECGEGYEEEYGEVTPNSNFEFYPISVWDADDHICGGVVSFRFNHDENGNPSDDIYLDYIVLIDGFSTTTNNKHSALTGLHWDDSGHSGNLDNSGYNITANYFTGTGDFTTTGGFVADSDSNGLVLGADQDVKVYGNGAEGGLTVQGAGQSFLRLETTDSSDAIQFLKYEDGDDHLQWTAGAVIPTYAWENSAEGESNEWRWYGYPTGESLKYGSIGIEKIGNDVWFQIATDSTGIYIPEDLNVTGDIQGDTVCNDDGDCLGDEQGIASLSVTVEVDSTTFASAHNVFNEDEYTSYEYTNNSLPVNITYYPKNGTFVVDEAGRYSVKANVIVLMSTADEYNMNVTHNGDTIYFHQVMFHSSLDPQPMPFPELIIDMGAGDYLQFHMNDVPTDGTDLHKIADGTTVSITQLVDASKAEDITINYNNYTVGDEAREGFTFCHYSGKISSDAYFNILGTSNIDCTSSACFEMPHDGYVTFISTQIYNSAAVAGNWDIYLRQEGLNTAFYTRHSWPAAGVSALYESAPTPINFVEGHSFSCYGDKGTGGAIIDGGCCFGGYFTP